MSHPNLFTPNDRIGTAVISGDRPAAHRPIAKLALAAAFVFSAMALVPSQAHASNWYASQNSSARVYDTQASLQSQNVETGHVVGIRPVTLRQNSSTNGGTMIGGLIGAALGNEIGHRTHGAARTLSTALGGIAGGYAGTRMSNRMSHHEAIQVFVRDDRTNRLISVVQDNDQANLAIGTEVQIVRGRNGLGVVPLTLSDERVAQGYNRGDDRGYDRNDDRGYDRGDERNDGRGYDRGYEPRDTRYNSSEDDGRTEDVQTILRSSRYRNRP